MCMHNTKHLVFTPCPSAVSFVSESNTKSMKRILTFLVIALSIATLFNSCKKDDDDNNTTGASNSGFNFCVEKDGTLIEGTASFRIISATRYRVQWEETVGGQYTNIEIDIYANSTGTYAVDQSNGANTAAFQYFDGTGYYGTSGTVEVTAVSSNEISGTFQATADDGSGNTFEFTNGNFVSVPVQ